MPIGLQFILLVWVFAIALLAVHYASPRIGAGPFIVILAGITTFLQIQIEVFFVPLPGIIIYLSSHIMLSVILMGILVLYVVNGSQVARLTMFGLIAVTCMIALFMLVAQAVLQPGSAQIGGSAYVLIANFQPRVVIASIATLLADMIAIAIVYQGSKNVFGSRIPEAIPAGLALLAALWTDAFLFILFSELGTPGFVSDIPGSLLGKSVMALVLWPVVAFYLTRFAPRLPDYQGGEKRPTFDLFRGGMNEVRLELVRVRADLAVREREVGEERRKVQSLRDFISEATHDLRTPLTAINLKVFRLGRTTDPAQQQAQLDELNDLTTRMNDMIDDMLTLSRLDSETDFVLAPVSLNELVRRVCGPLQALALDKDLLLDVNLRAADAPMLLDPEDIERAVTNLVSNAIRYTPRGGEVRVESHDDGPRSRLSVSDTGIGIKPEDQQRIFDRFYRSVEAQRMDPAGTGLGLVIVKRIVDLHQGELTLKSEVGKGTTFEIWLPRRPA
jgi:signal transduction histidine kinase